MNPISTRTTHGGDAYGPRWLLEAFLIATKAKSIMVNSQSIVGEFNTGYRFTDCAGMGPKYFVVMDGVYVMPFSIGALIRENGQ